MKLKNNIHQHIVSATHRKAYHLKAGVAVCGIAFASGLPLHPVTAQAANEAILNLPVEEAPRGLRRGETAIELTDAGKALANKYATRLTELHAEIGKQLPTITEEQKQASRLALAAQKLAELHYNSARGGVNLTNHLIALQSARENIEDGPAKLARAEMFLKNALAMPDGHPDKERAVEQATRGVEGRTKQLEGLQRNLERAENRLKNAEANLPENRKKAKAASSALAAAKAKATQVLQSTGALQLVASDKLDAKLVEATILTEATPYWLAVYAQQGSEHAQRVERLLANTPLLIEMLIADGAMWGKYGMVAEIYETIRNAHPKSSEGIFHRLALAIALEHAVPMIQSMPEDNDSTVYIDPVARYAAYEKAYLAGELDAGFETHCSWSLRMVVNGDEPDEISAWGREMLRSYRPDLISLPDESWRYVRSVETEIAYTSEYQRLGYDRADLQQYQNILAVGGICGRRAFFGRFILRAFGVPTATRSQQGHAALVRWTPNGWVCCLGAGWGSSNRTIFHRYMTDRDFLASTQAREDKESFIHVKRAQWIGTVLGEESDFGYRDNIRVRDRSKYANQSVEEVNTPPFWHGAAMIAQNVIIDRLGANALDAVGEDIGEANEALIRNQIVAVDIPAADREITVDASGVITIPAAATTVPTNNTQVIHFMPSNLGGTQLHYTRFGGSDTFAYTINAPKAGKYALTARLAIPSRKQYLFLVVNDATESVDIPLPYTIGHWGELEPFEIELKQGQNTLSFHRGHYYMRGVTIRDFTLTPLN